MPVPKTTAHMLMQLASPAKGKWVLVVPTAPIPKLTQLVSLGIMINPNPKLTQLALLRLTQLVSPAIGLVQAMPVPKATAHMLIN